jgi:hypothetical protein
MIGGFIPSSIKQPIEDNKPETRYEIQNRNKSRRAKTGSAHRAEHHRNKPRRQPSAARLVRSTVKPSISGIQPGTPMAAGTIATKRADARLAATMFRVTVNCTPPASRNSNVLVTGSVKCIAWRALTGDWLSPIVLFVAGGVLVSTWKMRQRRHAEDGSLAS